MFQRYCKLYRLYPMPDLPASLAEHFKRYATRDGSKPEARYRKPPPPPPDAPDEEDLVEVASAASTNRNGLNDPIKVRVLFCVTLSSNVTVLGMF